MPFLLVIVESEIRDPAKLLHDLAERGLFEPVVDGWLVTSPDDDPTRARTRARQRRYRARQRDARDADVRDARDGHTVGNSGNSGGVIHSLSAPKGQERVSETPNRDDRDATRRDADDATRRDADDADLREIAQARIRELKDELTAARSERGNE